MAWLVKIISIKINSNIKTKANKKLTFKFHHILLGIKFKHLFAYVIYCVLKNLKPLC